MAEAHVVGGDQVEAVGQRRHQVAEHLAAGRQAVQQQDRRRGGVARLPGRRSCGPSHRRFGGRCGWSLGAPSRLGSLAQPARRLPLSVRPVLFVLSINRGQPLNREETSRWTEGPLWIVSMPCRCCSPLSRAAACRRRAASCGLPLATVSRKVAELEAHLNATLLIRSAKGLELTPAGRSYVTAAKAILEQLNEANARRRANTPSPRATSWSRARSCSAGCMCCQW
jgi:hypothetical protein